MSQFGLSCQLKSVIEYFALQNKKAYQILQFYRGFSRINSNAFL